MATSAIDSLTSSSSNPSGVNRFADMSSEQFLKVMMTELQSQDPLDPQDSSKLLEQLSSIRNIESQLKLNDQLSTLVTQNQFASAGGLIGKLVAGLDDSNNQVYGQVMSVRLANDKVYLGLDSGVSLDMSRVTEIADAKAAGA